MDIKLGYYCLKRKEVTPLLPKTYSKVLEIGCGEGNFRENLKLQHEYWGVEPVTPVAEIAATKLDKVLVGTFQEMINEIPDDYFDLVICNDVIEHMPDHDAFFCAIKSKISSNGCIVASIPNVRYITNLFEILIKKNWEYKNKGILDRTHMRYFTKKSLQKTIADNNFSFELFTGLNPYRSDSFFIRLVSFFATFLLGRDSRFLQFGIRIIPKDSVNKESIGNR